MLKMPLRLVPGQRTTNVAVGLVQESAACLSAQDESMATMKWSEINDDELNLSELEGLVSIEGGSPKPTPGFFSGEASVWLLPGPLNTASKEECK